MYNKKQINIYIVEDNNVFTMVLKADIESVFSDKPITVQSFETGEKFIEKFKVEKPQVVILDYFLNSVNPDAMDGIKVLDLIKKEHPETNVIMLTGNDNLDIAIKAFQHGASDYVVKTETKFKKINYSLLNLLNLMQAKRDVKTYKYLLGIFFVVMAVVVGVVVSIQIFMK